MAAEKLRAHDPAEIPIIGTSMSDPRVYFAAERTVLAWTRTGLTIMGFGFVVARFGLFLRLLAAEHSGSGVASALPTRFSGVVGIGLVLVGSATLVLAAFQHRRFVASLPPADVPASNLGALPTLVPLLLGALGLVLAVYLAV